MMWNDQPWLHTLLMAHCFRVFGEHAAIPRLFNVVSMAALLVACAWILREMVGPLELFVMGLFLICAENMANLIPSAMLELPAYSWAVVAVAICYGSAASAKPWRWLISGGVFAIAMQFKLTAAVVLPAFAAMVLVWVGLRRALQIVKWWALGFVPVFVLIAAISPTFDLNDLCLTHIRSTMALESGQGQRFVLQPAWLLGTPGFVLASVIGLSHPALRRRSPPLVFAATL